MYRAIILGHGRRYEANTLELLIQQLQRERYRVETLQKNRLREGLDNKRCMIVPATRRLTQSEMIREHIRKPYLWPPRMNQTEVVKVRFEYHERV